MSSNFRALTPDELDALEKHQLFLQYEKIHQDKRADFNGHDFSRANLRNRDFRRVNLRGANLAYADLTGAKFAGANLSNVKLYGADLSEARLDEAKGLQSIRQLAGTDTTRAELPSTISKFEGLEQASELARISRTIYLLLIAACVFSWLSIATTEDAQLVVDTINLKLPIIQTEVAVARFYWMAPLGLFLVYLYFHVYLQRLWEELSSLPAIFPDGRTLVRKVYPWQPIGIAWAHISLLKLRRPSLYNIQILIAILSVWCLVPITLVLFWGRYLVTREVVDTVIQSFLIVGSVAFGVFSYGHAKATLRGKLWSPHFDGTENTKRNTPEKSLIYSSVRNSLIATTTIVGIISYGFLNPQNECRPRTSEILGPSCWGPSLLDYVIRYSPYLEIRGAQISNKPSGWKGYTHEHKGISGIDLVKRANLKEKNLHRAYAEGAFLVRAEMNNTNLAHAKLRRAYLQGANLSEADLGKAILIDARLENTKLNHAKMSNAELTRAKLRDAELIDTRLENANLNSANLENTKLMLANLNGANMRAANLVKARLWSATGIDAELNNSDLTNADLRYVNLERANLGNAKLNCTKLVSANLEGASLEGADLSGANLRDTNFGGADLTGVKGLESARHLKDACFDNDTVLPANLINQVNVNQECLWKNYGDIKESNGGSEGEMIFRTLCVNCHSLEQGTHKIGPSLHKIFGKNAGSSEGYLYSRTMESSRIKWNRESLFTYLEDPESYVPGNRMDYPGLKDDRQRNELIDYLEGEPDANTHTTGSDIEGYREWVGDCPVKNDHKQIDGSRRAINQDFAGRYMPSPLIACRSSRCVRYSPTGYPFSCFENRSVLPIAPMILTRY